MTTLTVKKETTKQEIFDFLNEKLQEAVKSQFNAIYFESEKFVEFYIKEVSTYNVGLDKAFAFVNVNGYETIRYYKKFNAGKKWLINEISKFID